MTMEYIFDIYDLDKLDRHELDNLVNLLVKINEDSRLLYDIKSYISERFIKNLEEKIPVTFFTINSVCGWENFCNHFGNIYKDKSLYKNDEIFWISKSDAEKLELC